MQRSFVLLALVLLLLSACKSTPTRKALTWPQVNALPSEPPADLERTAPTTVLRPGSDGFVYVVGGLPDDVATGTRFMARYSGDWPLQDLPRPPLASGRVLKRYGRDVAVAQLDYVMPDSSLSDLEVTWVADGAEEEQIGKGVATVQKLSPTRTTDLQLSAPDDVGVQPGDIYALLAPVDTVDDSKSVQMARRLLGICLVEETSDEGSNCRLWRGSSMVPGRRPIAVGDDAVFLEHTYGNAPRDGVIQIANVAGTGGEGVQERLLQTFRTYVSSLPQPKAGVEPVEASIQASSADLHRAEESLEYGGAPQLVVAAEVVDVDGVPHLFVNYTGVGPATGPGMVAAPPEGGVDLGKVSEVSDADLRAFAGTVWSAMLVYRGQTSEALMHLHLLLSDPSFQGAFRWHARDQYAMRWAALGHEEQALWLVLEDEAVALDQSDDRAYLNALGTRVRLYDMLGLQDRAVQASENYLTRRKSEQIPAESPVLFALGMHAEMLMNAGEIEQARAAIADLRERCPTGCSGDLFGLIAGVYWSVPPENQELRAELLAELLALGQAGSKERLASARLYQGLAALGEDNLEDALIAFLEAERLFGTANNLPGIARTKHLMFLTQIALQDPQKAFELAMEAIESERQLGDFDSAAQTYERLAALYVNFDAKIAPGPWLGAARDVLAATIQASLAQGNYSKASEALFGLGAFLLRVGALDESQMVLQRGVLYAIRTARFDIAAMCHMWLGILAREQRDFETFRDEIYRAKVMAEISDDPEVMEAIEQILNPPAADDTPTQVL